MIEHKPTILPFWGPFMNDVFHKLHEKGIHGFESLSPLQFAYMVDDLCGIKHEEHADPEVVAEEWLKYL